MICTLIIARTRRTAGSSFNLGVGGNKEKKPTGQ